MIRAIAGAISRARARTRAHLDTVADGRERGEIQGGQLCVLLNLTNVRPCASSAEGEARRGAHGCGLNRRGAGEGGRACTTRLPVMVVSAGRLRLLSAVFST